MNLQGKYSALPEVATQLWKERGTFPLNPDQNFRSSDRTKLIIMRKRKNALWSPFSQLAWTIKLVTKKLRRVYLHPHDSSHMAVIWLFYSCCQVMWSSSPHKREVGMDERTKSQSDCRLFTFIILWVYVILNFSHSFYGFRLKIQKKKTQVKIALIGLGTSF